MIEDMSEETLVKVMSEFKCEKNGDIQDFLQNRALEYEKRGWCSVYVLINRDKSESDNFYFVDGYFTLSNKVVYLSE